MYRVTLLYGGCGTRGVEPVTAFLVSLFAHARPAPGSSRDQCRFTVINACCRVQLRVIFVAGSSILGSSLPKPDFANIPQSLASYENLLSSLSGERVGRCRPAAEPVSPAIAGFTRVSYTAAPAARSSRFGPPSAGRDFIPLSPEQSLLAFLCCLQRMVSAAQTPFVRRVELGVGCVLSFPLMIREHAVLRRSLCATLTALIDPLAAPSGAIADGFAPCPVFRAEVMWIGLLGLRLDRPGVQGSDPGAQCVQVRHRSRSFVDAT